MVDRCTEQKSRPGNHIHHLVLTCNIVLRSTSRMAIQDSSARLGRCYGSCSLDRIAHTDRLRGHGGQKRFREARQGHPINIPSCHDVLLLVLDLLHTAINTDQIGILLPLLTSLQWPSKDQECCEIGHAVGRSGRHSVRLWRNMAMCACPSILAQQYQRISMYRQNGFLLLPSCFQYHDGPHCKQNRSSLIGPYKDAC